MIGYSTIFVVFVQNSKIEVVCLITHNALREQTIHYT